MRMTYKGIAYVIPYVVCKNVAFFHLNTVGRALCSDDSTKNTFTKTLCKKDYNSLFETNVMLETASVLTNGVYRVKMMRSDETYFRGSVSTVVNLHKVRELCEVCDIKAARVNENFYKMFEACAFAHGLKMPPPLTIVAEMIQQQQQQPVAINNPQNSLMMLASQTNYMRYEQEIERLQQLLMEKHEEVNILQARFMAVEEGLEVRALKQQLAQKDALLETLRARCAALEDDIMELRVMTSDAGLVSEEDDIMTSEASVTLRKQFTAQQQLLKKLRSELQTQHTELERRATELKHLQTVSIPTIRLERREELAELENRIEDLKQQHQHHVCKMQQEHLHELAQQESVLRQQILQTPQDLF